jgi:hypothetical protein
MPANYIEEALRRTLPLLTLLTISGCSIFQQQPAARVSPSPVLLSPSASGPLLLGLWVLSPIGVKLRDQPSTSGTQVATIPQGTKLTATAKQGSDPVWYKVAYGGASGWIAARVPGSSPPLDLVSIHPQLSFSSSGNDYYFLYPATWSVADRGADVEVDASTLGATPGLSPASPPAASGAPQAGVGTARLLMHSAAGVGQLGAIPTTPGSNLDSLQIEVGGITVIEHTYQLSGGGLEADVKVGWAPGKALLITFRAATQPELATFHEILDSFGFSTPPSPAPSSSP